MKILAPGLGEKAMICFVLVTPRFFLPRLSI